MKKLLALIILILLLLVIYRSSSQDTNYATIAGVEFKAEIANTDKAKEIGLSKYSSIENDFALVFPFEKKGKHSFWMKDMKFPIDIIFIRDGKIIKIYENVPFPKSQNENLTIYRPNEDSNMVIEIKAGISKKNNFRNGDIVKIK